MRRTKITIVTRERLSLPPNILAGSSPAQVEAWCAACAARVVWLTPEQAAAAGCDTRQVYRWIESGALHFAEAGCALHICWPSLLALLEAPPANEAQRPNG